MKTSLKREQVLARSREADRRALQALKQSDGAGEMVIEVKPKKVAKKSTAKKTVTKKKGKNEGGE